ncbi:MAG TPA: 2-oxoacid:ferredoxin oxidoreductase subunit beta [Anaerolineaceae bacterium]|jgi:2-oxoglutarate ferredoxin oxidoreductase subunit beta|nr:2-oxoacid:ferredoxin oxidoreductase subunit beta [Longilinea sp.]HNR46093.1 2-oxoacid:ferredoxin oxidoreductase subunit beta [Anaerolineaceae bacterium]HNS38293.1 2-oxoacid:ferredoxin oxidoreductase subunit beta [Anaerolineaceae bacterium]HOD05454.1 2-oxoacid:ferredoxin oxidoreductase subunit beta [Anaerolineaceae bacterium]HOG79340.1 2-oxoacid:ferredoxin oxidoreductase subunit beta [Anaerolineaceae bacterium]
MATQAAQQLNQAGLSRADYKGAPSTLCQGCGHNGIASQITSALYELNVVPETVVKFSGIGCSSKSPTYFLSRSFAFNGVHGRMPSLALGALFGDARLHGIGVSGDGDTASIGIGQFKHIVRRNMPMVYIVENNGVYGLTKGQFSATAELGLSLKRQGTNPFLPVDICLEALASNASFVARSFAGDPRQLKELLKAAYSHRGIAVIDIISPCVTFHNQDGWLHSYTYGKEHEEPLHEISYVPARDEVTVEDFEEGTTRDVELHDGAVIRLKKLERDYDPTNRAAAFQILEEANQSGELVTGLIYVNPEIPSMFDAYNLPEEGLNRLPAHKLRPTPESLDRLNASFA